MRQGGARMIVAEPTAQDVSAIMMSVQYRQYRIPDDNPGGVIFLAPGSSAVA